MSNLDEIKDPRTEIILNDKSYNLKYDFNAFAELEEKYGSLDEFYKQMSLGRINVVKDVVWAGLLHKSEELTPKDIGKFLNFDNIKDISFAVREAMKKAMPKHTEGDIEEVSKKKTTEEVKKS